MNVIERVLLLHALCVISGAVSEPRNWAPMSSPISVPLHANPHSRSGRKLLQELPEARIKVPPKCKYIYLYIYIYIDIYTYIYICIYTRSSLACILCHFCQNFGTKDSTPPISSPISATLQTRIPEPPRSSWNNCWKQKQLSQNMAKRVSWTGQI